MEEIKRLQRLGAWWILPDRYALLRGILLELCQDRLVDFMKADSSIQDVIARLRDIERRIDRAIETGDYSKLSATKLNSDIGKYMEVIHSALAAVKTYAQ